MNKRFKSITVFVLVLALIIPMIVPDGQSRAATMPPENMGTIPFNTPFVMNTALGEPHDGENWYMYYSFTTGPKKAYYSARIAEDTTLPNWHFSTEPDTDYHHWIGYSYLSFLSGLTEMMPNTTYYLLVEKTRYPVVPEVTVTLEEIVDDYGDTADTGNTIYADKEYKGCAEDHADQDVFIFNTGNTTYTLNFGCSTNTGEIAFYTDKDLKKSVYAPLLTGDHDASEKLEKNTTYYIKVRPERWEKVDYSIKMISADPSQAVKDPSATGAPVTTASPGATTAPGTTSSPASTNAPGATTSPAATNAPGVTASPGATTAPGTTSSPAATNAPGTTTAPDVTASPGSTTAPTVTQTPTEAKTMNYRSYIKKNKYVTNRISNVSAVIKGSHVKIKKASGGYICKLWKLGAVFRKSAEMKKKSYSFKLAKGCRIVWDPDSDGKKGTIESKGWFNKNFKKNGAMYGQREFGLCVNKKGKVVLIYTGDMFGAEQT